MAKVITAAGAKALKRGKTVRVAKKLTAAAVKSFLPGKVVREIADGGCPGLRVVVQPSGHRSFAMRFRRPSGQSANLILGPCDTSRKEPASEPVIGAPLTLASARELATAINRERASGVDVIAARAADKRRQKAEREAQAASTFAVAARRFIEQHSRPNVRRWQEQARLLGLRPADLEVIPGGLADNRWANKPVAEIDGDDVHSVIEEVRTRGVPGLARRRQGASESVAAAMFAVLSRLFSWLIEKRVIEKNPVAGVARPKASEARDRVLSDDEIRWFWSACGEIGEPFKSLLRVLLLTGQRLNEVAGMTRAELSHDDAGRPIWTLPASRTKNRKVHVVPITPAVEALIKSVPVIAARPGAPSFVFSTTGRTAVSGFSKIKRALDAKMLVLAQAEKPEAVIAAWVLHDVRRSAASGLQRCGVPLPVTEKVLNHISGSFAGIVAVYQQHEYSEEKRLALWLWAMHVEALVARRPSLERWAAHVESLTAGRAANVMPFKAS
ncbi:MAG: tyrosine-type recombinase/integrase [Roseiarcus sp.]